jgi:thiamine biosynthesis lipoprotein
MTSPGAATLALYSHHVAGRALGCHVYLATADPADLMMASRVAADLLEHVDRTCSRFRADSDLVRANALAGQWVDVDPLLVAALTTAIAAAVETDGLVDPTLGHSLAAAGYDRDFTIVPASSADPAAVPAPGSTGGWRHVGVDPAGAVRVPAGQLLDLGATAKAWAADLLAETIRTTTGDTAVVSLGGDVRVAGDPDIRWPVEVTELPLASYRNMPGTRPELSPARLLMPPGGLATSSTAHRRWLRAGQPLHHIVDPMNGLPAQGPWRTVSATGETAVSANTTTTAAIVLGHAAIDWLGERGVPARLVGHDGQVVTVNGWPAQGVA